MLKPSLNLICLFVTNPQKSSQFYQDILNLKPIEQSPTFTLFALDNQMMLGLWSKHTAEPLVTANSGSSEICFSCTDVDALYQVWGQKHLTVLQKPTDMDFGRSFVVLDPDGHRIRIYKMHERR